MINKLLYTRLIGILLFVRLYQRKCPNCLICFKDNNYLNPRNIALLEKLTDSLIIKKFPEFYGTRNFINTITRARHLFLS